MNEKRAKCLTPLKSIRAKCVDCCCGQSAEVRLCVSKTCPLWGYRLGHRPNHTKTRAGNADPKKAI